MNRDRAPAATIRDVARAAGVSTATVSRVLSGSAAVSDRVRERVTATVAAVGYHPNRLSTSLRRRSTSVVGLVISDISNPFFTTLVRGLEDAARADSMSLILCNTDEDPSKEREYLDVLLSQRVAGIALVPTQENADFHLRIRQMGIPLVYVDRPGPVRDLDSVVSANRAGAKAAVRHLLEHGRKRVAAVTGPNGIGSTEQRTRGYLDALAEDGVQQPIIARADLREKGGFEQTRRLLDREHPDALFVTNNLMALGALEAVRNAGLRIPDDIAFVGVDKILAGELIDPPLSVLWQDPYELGRTAGRLLRRRRLEPSARPEHVQLDMKLVVRQSCGDHLEASREGA